MHWLLRLSIALSLLPAAAPAQEAATTAAPAARAVGKHSQESLKAIFALTESTIYIMGFSFVLGSLFTILLLILLDFMRSKAARPPENHDG